MSQDKKVGAVSKVLDCVQEISASDIWSMQLHQWLALATAAAAVTFPIYRVGYSRGIKAQNSKMAVLTIDAKRTGAELTNVQGELRQKATDLARSIRRDHQGLAGDLGSRLFDRGRRLSFKNAGVTRRRIGSGLSGIGAASVKIRAPSAGP